MLLVQTGVGEHQPILWYWVIFYSCDATYYIPGTHYYCEIRKQQQSYETEEDFVETKLCMTLRLRILWGPYGPIQGSIRSVIRSIYIMMRTKCEAAEFKQEWGVGLRVYIFWGGIIKILVRLGGCTYSSLPRVGSITYHVGATQAP